MMPASCTAACAKACSCAAVSAGVAIASRPPIEFAADHRAAIAADPDLAGVVDLQAEHGVTADFAALAAPEAGSSAIPTPSGNARTTRPPCGASRHAKTHSPRLPVSRASAAMA